MNVTNKSNALLEKSFILSIWIAAKIDMKFYKLIPIRIIKRISIGKGNTVLFSHFEDKNSLFS